MVDLQGLTMSHRSCIKYMTTIAALDQQYYPESLGKTYIINAPWIFPALWKLIRGMLDPVTTEKIHVLGHNYQEVLRERFDPNDLPSEYGGSCRCEAGCIPEYTEQQALQIVAEAERKLNPDELTLNAGQQHVVRQEMGPWGGSLQVYFKSAKSDIGFQAVFTPLHPAPSAAHSKGRRRSSTDQVPVLTVPPAAAASASSSASSASSAPSVRECPYGETVWQEHARFPPQQPHKLSFVTDYPGVAVLTFDNRHSWRHAEPFKYKVQYTQGKEGVRKEHIMGMMQHQQQQQHSHSAAQEEEGEDAATNGA